jgi:hypothetical protein
VALPAARRTPPLSIVPGRRHIVPAWIVTGWCAGNAAPASQLSLLQAGECLASARRNAARWRARSCGKATGSAERAYQRKPLEDRPMDEIDQIELHEQQVKAVMAAVAKLLPRFGPAGFSPEAIFEGAVKGGAVALMTGSDVNADDIAALLETVGEGFRHLDEPKLRVVS